MRKSWNSLISYSLFLIPYFLSPSTDRNHRTGNTLRLFLQHYMNIWKNIIRKPT